MKRAMTGFLVALGTIFLPAAAAHCGSNQDAFAAAENTAGSEPRPARTVVLSGLKNH
jgi:hypothetical protein